MSWSNVGRVKAMRSENYTHVDKQPKGFTAAEMKVDLKLICV